MINYNKILIDSALLNNIGGVKNALNKGADINYQDREGTTALIAASWKGHIELIKILLEIPGIKLHLENKFKFSAVKIAGKKASNTRKPEEIKKYLEIINLLENFNEKQIKS